MRSIRSPTSPGNYRQPRRERRAKVSISPSSTSPTPPISSGKSRPEPVSSKLKIQSSRKAPKHQTPAAAEHGDIDSNAPTLNRAALSFKKALVQEAKEGAPASELLTWNFS